MMFTTSIYGETLVREFTHKNIPFELVQCPATIWCGALGYASNCMEEPDIGGLLKQYQNSCHIPKQECANPDWSCCISIDYWQEGAVPRGMIFAQQVLTEKQDSIHDVYTMPESLYIRVAGTKEVAQAAFGRECCELYELFGVIREAMVAESYVVNPNGAQEIEMYAHGAGLSYAYVPVK